jgi:hypothetical protein
VDFRRCLPLTSRKQANQYLLRRFTGQASRDGNVSGNIHADPPTSMKSSDPVFKPFSDMRGSQWTRLGITGVRLPSPPAFARLTPELRLARQPKANQAECRVCSSRAKAVRHSSASSERRRTSCFAFAYFPFARLTPELRLARQPKSQQVPKPHFVQSGKGCPP